MKLSIEEIAKACDGELHIKNIDSLEEVTSVVLDSRIVTKDGVFVATVGERVDGNRFVGDVFDKGVSLVITEKTPKQVYDEHQIPVEKWGSYCVVKDCFKALKDIAEYYRLKLDIPVVGITGSVGKTSTKEFIAGVLSAKYNCLKTEGNYNNEIGVPLTLLRIREEHEAAIVEMGISDFGEMHRLSKMVRPTVAVITNIGQCHLENLKTRDGILKAKTEIFDFMSEDAEVFLNGDDDKLVTVQEVNKRKVHFFGYSDENNSDIEFFATNVVSNGLWGSEITLNISRKRKIRVSVPLPGKHMVVNATAAAGVADILGLTDEEIKEGLSRVSSVGGRNNLISLDKFTVIDDCYNANPVSMKAALDLLCMADNTKIAILGDMFELGTDSLMLHGQVGEYAAIKKINRLYCVGESSKCMYDEAVKNNACGMDIRYFVSLEELISALGNNLEEMIPKNSTVLIKASHGMKFAQLLDFLKESSN